MHEIELEPPPDDIAAAIEAAAFEAGVKIHRGSLARYPGSIHWHFTRAGEKGTLEATWWPSKNRLWLSIHSNRAAAWQDDAVRTLQALLSSQPGDAGQ
jgi:hypothetical protein